MRNMICAMVISGVIGGASSAGAESAVDGAEYQTPQAVSTAAGTSATLFAKKAVITPPENYKPLPVEAFESSTELYREVGKSLRRLHNAKKKYQDVITDEGKLPIPLRAKMLSEIHGQGTPPPGETPEKIEQITSETDRKLQEVQKRAREGEQAIKDNPAKDTPKP